MFKNSLSNFLIALFLGSLLFACKKEKETEEPSYFSVKVDGVLKETSDVAVLISYPNNWSLTARFPTGERIDVLIEDPRVATYQGSSVDNPAQLFYSDTDSPLATSYMATNLFLKITSVKAGTGEIAGNFTTKVTANLEDKLQLSEGKFDVRFQVRNSGVIIPGR